MIYEERRTLLSRGALPQYIQLCRDAIWASVRSSGGRVLRVLSGLIGDPIDELLQIVAYQDLTSWQAAQDYLTIERGGLVEREEVRLLRSVASHPKEGVPDEDRRSVYGYRRFYIAPASLAEFVRCSEEGIWPRIEGQGARILGLWATAAASTPLEVVLITGYHSSAHWEETRRDRPRPEAVDEAVWERDRAMAARRLELTLRTSVRLMRAVDL